MSGDEWYGVCEKSPEYIKLETNPGIKKAGVLGARSYVSFQFSFQSSARNFQFLRDLRECVSFHSQTCKFRKIFFDRGHFFRKIFDFVCKVCFDVQK